MLRFPGSVWPWVLVLVASCQQHNFNMLAGFLGAACSCCNLLPDFFCMRVSLLAGGVPV